MNGLATLNSGSYASDPITSDDWREDIQPYLVQMASRSPKMAAHAIFGEVLDIVFQKHKRRLKGADLVRLIDDFNAAQPSGLRLPLGTAGTAQRAVAEFDRTLAERTHTRLMTANLPNAAVRAASRLIDELASTLRTELAIPFAEEVQSIRANCERQLAEARTDAEARVDQAFAAQHAAEAASATMNIELRGVRSELQATTTDLAALRSQHSTLIAAEAGLRSERDSLLQQVHGLEERLAHAAKREEAAAKWRAQATEDLRLLEVRLERETAEKAAALRDALGARQALEQANLQHRQLVESLQARISDVVRRDPATIAGPRRASLAVKPARRPVKRPRKTGR